MRKHKEEIKSKLPNTGTSIFAVMTGLAHKHNAVNLSQGFPDFPVSPGLIDLVSHYMKKGFNQYAPMTGTPELRNSLREMFQQNHGASYDAEKEINITAGATQALYTAISAFIHPGDEVIIFEPAYDSYAPAVEINGGIVMTSQLCFPDYRIDWEEVEQMVSSHTKMIIINSPQNPTGSILSETDLKRLEELINGKEIIVLSDEVYEHLIFEGLRHESVCRFPGLAAKSLLVGSFGKTFHATGWKVGFVMAPEKLMNEYRKVHQFVVFAVNTPIQMALAEFLQTPENYTGLGKFFQEKRDFFVNAIKTSRFKVIPAKGTYFQLLDYSNISNRDELDFATWLVSEHGLAAVPVSPFYQHRENNHVLRFCFAKELSTLEKAAKILCEI